MSTSRGEQPGADDAATDEPQSPVLQEPDERQSRALRQVVEWLEVQRPGRRVVVRIQLANRERRVSADWEFPGIVRVALKTPSGEPLCQSEPGYPDRLEQSACSREERWSGWDISESASLARSLAGGEREAILRIASDALRASARPTTYIAHLGCGRAARRVRVQYSWPGVVDVTDCKTGALIVRSLPGQPTVPDESAPAAQPESER